MELELIVLLLGFTISLLSGLFGIGGGILMAPALLYLPSLLGIGFFDMKQVAGLTITQGLVACLAGARRHHQEHRINRRLVMWMGPAILVSALVGSVLSNWVANGALLFLFAGFAVVAAVLMLFVNGTDREVAEADSCTFNTPVAVGIATGVGLLGGLVGQGGSFALIPLMLIFLRLPTRVVIGSNLALVFFSSLAGFVGKFTTGQVLLMPALFLVVGAVPGAQLGARLSQRARPAWLRRGLTAVVILMAVGICLDLAL